MDPRSTQELTEATGSSPSSSSSQPPWWQSPERVTAVVGAIAMRTQELFTGKELISEGTLFAVLTLALGAPLTAGFLRLVARRRGNGNGR